MIFSYSRKSFTITMSMNFEWRISLQVFIYYFLPSSIIIKVNVYYILLISISILLLKIFIVQRNDCSKAYFLFFAISVILLFEIFLEFWILGGVSFDCFRNIKFCFNCFVSKLYDDKSERAIKPIIALNCKWHKP